MTAVAAARLPVPDWPVDTGNARAAGRSAPHVFAPVDATRVREISSLVHQIEFDWLDEILAR